MKKISFLFWVLVFLFNFSTTSIAASTSDILFVLDASGSMEALVDGKSQMDIAKASIRETLPGIPADVPVGLRVYAHRVPKTDKENSCKDTELLVPLEAGSASKISSAITGIVPRGYTPIANSLRAAAGDFRGRESQSVIILLSDGEETCGGDPVAEAKNLLAQGIKLTIHTIGFRVDEKTRAQLKSISDATGGMYFDASDAASLTQNLKTVTQKATFLDKPREDGRGQEIRGGSQFADAVKLEKGIEYHLDHHQRAREYDYFYVDAKRGQMVTASAMTLAHGVNVDGNDKAVESGSPYNGFKIHDATFKELGSEELIGAAHAKRSRSISVVADQKIYILIGSGYDNVHKESPFQVDIADLFDGGSQTDAGNDITQALEISAGDYPKNYLQHNDSDWFKISVKAGEVYEVKSLPGSVETSVRLEVMDTNRIRLAGNGSPNGGALARVESVTIPEDGYMYVGVSSYDGGEAKEYSLSIKRKEAPVAPIQEEKIKPAATTRATEKSPSSAPTLVREAASSKPSLMNNVLFLKVLLGLSVLLNLFLTVLWLMAKLKR